MQDFERLGALYLGRQYDLEQAATKKDLLLYDAKDLTTHAVCIGMTGSGKTGLCLSLLEEAALDRIPALIIDPKGDLGNLLLTFPGLAAADFRPWIDEAEATRKGRTADEHARQVADLWRRGLAEWGQDGDRIDALKAACDMAIYTPGASAGLSLQVLRSFAAPPADLLADPDALREKVASATSGLLALLGIDADPVRSREYILLSNIIDRAWREGRDLDLPRLIRDIQSPPFDKLGVFDLETFFSQKDRLGLSMTLNNLLASPGFAAWMEGEPLDIARLLHTPAGLPRLSILSIAHLSDAERMFFVTLLLNELVAWMRSQPGTTSLRAILYMDEVFGYLPPSANPSSKTPLLTLLKQARAYGLGVVLATQNPVDLDYKALSNAGTWFLGRLQTQRDKDRVLDGLEGVAATGGGGFDRQRMEAVLSGLGSRVFLMHNVHEDAPVLFHTRWAMSYLRGPLTRQQISRLMADRKGAARTAVGATGAPIGTADGPTTSAPPLRTPTSRAPALPTPSGEPTGAGSATGQERPMVPPDVPQTFIALSPGVPGSGRLIYRPALLARCRLHHVSARHQVDQWQSTTLLAPLVDDVTTELWTEATALRGEELELAPAPEERGGFLPPPAAALRARSYTGWKKQLIQHLYRSESMILQRCRALKQISRPGEGPGDFRVRLGQASREQRDLKVERLRKRYAPRLARLQERLRKAGERMEREESQYENQKLQTAISIGATILGGLFGRKTISSRSVGRATTAMRGVGRTKREKSDIGRAAENIASLQDQFEELELELQEEIETVRADLDPTLLELEEVVIRPRKADIQVVQLALAWTPWLVDQAGIATPACDVLEI